MTSIHQVSHVHQEQPGAESQMRTAPKFEAEWYRGVEKLRGKVAIITGGDSGIGRSVATLFAREGANVVIAYLNEHDDARKVQEVVEKEGTRAVLCPGDIGNEAYCRELVDTTIREFGSIDILVNNAGEQHYQEKFEDITTEQIMRTFQTNIIGAMILTKLCLPHMKEGSTIINTVSVTGYSGWKELIDYSSTKGALTSFTRSLALSVADRGIRVNAVAPGPIWTPLIDSTFPKGYKEAVGKQTPMKRFGQPEEVSPCYVFLASQDSSYMTGQVLHPNGGSIVNG